MPENAAWPTAAGGGGHAEVRCRTVASEKRSPSAFSSLQGYLQPQIYPERSTSVPLTSPVRDVCAEKAQSLLLVKNEGVPQQVL